MRRPQEYEPFWSLIDKALSDRKKNSAALAKHPDLNAPLYVVELCEALLQAIHNQGNKSVTLKEVAMLESTCTGADYQHKLAMRCFRLANGQAV